MTSYWTRCTGAAGLAMATLLMVATSAAAVTPTSTAVEGFLLSSGGGAAADGTYDMSFKVYPNSSTTTAVWSEGPVKVTVAKGQFFWALGSKTKLDIAKISATATPFLGIKIGADPELPRRALHSTLFALHANSADKLTCTGCVSASQVANGGISAAKVGFNYAGSTTKGGAAKDLSCTGCVSVKELKFDANVDLGAYNVKAKNGTFTGGVAASTVSATTFLGDGSKLTGIKIPSGECKVKGEVVKGINADGTLKCIKAVDPTALPADGLNEISNNLLSNQFVDTIEAPLKKVKIPDNTGSQAISNITFPNIGTAQTFEAFVHVENTNLAKVAMVILPPDDKKTGWTLCDPCGATDAKIYKKTFSPTAKPKSGDPAKWVGKNPQGLWTLKVQDTGYCVPQAPGNAKYCDTNNKTDGWIATWHIKIQTLSNQKIGANGSVYVGGELKGKDNGHGTKSDALKVGSDMNVTGGAVVGGNIRMNGRDVEPAVYKNAKKYSVVFGVRDPKYCPKGFTLEKASDYRGGNNYVYLNIHENGLFFGSVNGTNYGSEQSYVGFNLSNFPAYICHHTYDSPNGNAHTSVLLDHNGAMSKGTCPTGYHYLPHVTTRGSNNYSYATSTKAGIYIGYVDTWSYDCRTHDEGGCMRRNWRSNEAGGVCVRTFGVTADPATQNGVYPVFLGLHKDDKECPSGWNKKPTTEFDSSNGYFYLTMTNNASFAGARYDWWYSSTYSQVHFNNSHVKYVCWKYLPTKGKPYAQVRTLQYKSSCPTGFLSFSAANIKGWNSNAYMQQAAGSLYIGGLYSWTRADQTKGWIAHNWTSYLTTKLCLKLENVKM